jgi:transcriptional regulator with XRE-family HTH domain
MAEDERSFAAVGRRLLLSRAARHMSQTAYARAAGIAPSTFNNYEKGVSVPSREHALALFDAHGLSLDWIFRSEPAGLDPKLRASISALRNTVAGAATAKKPKRTGRERGGRQFSGVEQ